MPEDKMDVGYSVCILLSDEPGRELDPLCLAASLLSIRSFCGNVTVYVVGSDGRHGRSFDALPPLGVHLIRVSDALPLHERVDALRRMHITGTGTGTGTGRIRDERERIVALPGPTSLVWSDLALVADGHARVEDAVTVDACAIDMLQRWAAHGLRLTFWASSGASAAPPINIYGEVPVPVALPDEGDGDPSPGPSTGTRYYVVHLRGCAARERAVSRLRESLPNLTVVDAVDGAALGADELRLLAAEGFLQPPFVDRLVNGAANGRRRLLVNSVAVTLSHRRALQAVADDMAGDSSSGSAVVFEDDVAVRPGRFLPVVEGVLATARDLHVDLVRLYVMPSQMLMFRKPARSGVRYVLSRTPRDQWGTQAYLVPDAGAAARALAGLWPMLGAVDEQLSRVPDLAAYTLVGPPIVDELADEAPSVTLGAARPPRYVDDVLYSRRS